ncbi:MAG: hypothetical protein ACI9LV_000725 [Candidatus Nanohaloarchaea archaeon]|jgi:hypothetical protein
MTVETKNKSGDIPALSASGSDTWNTELSISIPEGELWYFENALFYHYGGSGSGYEGLYSRSGVRRREPNNDITSKRYMKQITQDTINSSGRELIELGFYASNETVDIVTHVRVYSSYNYSINGGKWSVQIRRVI